MPTPTIPANWPCRCGVELCASHAYPELSCPACGVVVSGANLLKLDLSPKRKTFDADAHRRFMKSLG
jgi:hypothetical protein